MRDGLADEREALLFSHVGLVVLIHPGVEEDGTGATHGVVMLNHGASEGDVEDGTSVDGVVSTDDDAGLDHVAVAVAHLTEDRGDGLDGDVALVVGVDGVLAHVAGDDLGEGLSISGGARSAAVDVVEELGELVGDAVDDVGAGGGAGVSGEDDTAIVGDGDNGGTEVVATAGLLAVVLELGVLDGGRDGEALTGSVEGAEGGVLRDLVLQVLGFLDKS